MDDSGSSSSSEEDNYMSAAEELSLSPTPHHYETPPDNNHERVSTHSEGEDDGVNDQDGEDEELNAVVVEPLRENTEMDTVTNDYRDQRNEVIEKAVENKGASSSDEEFEHKYSYKCLKRLDRDFFPALV